MRPKIIAAAGATLFALSMFVDGACCPVWADENAGLIQPNATRPFLAKAVATFDTPWAIAFLPDDRLLITQKGGQLFLVTQQGEKRRVGGVPKVQYEGQNGLLDVAISPRFAADGLVYLTYMEPGPGGSSLALALARLVESGAAASLADFTVIWRQMPKGGGGQPGGIVAFGIEALGKVLRLNPDGTTPPDNPWSEQGGVRAQLWTLGHRNPYGLAFAPNGDLWLDEMGPRGGDELNLIRPGGNYGWPIVSNGDNYDGTPIPRHSTHPEFLPPVVYWNPVIAPAGLAFYTGDLFPQWRGSALIGGLAGMALVRIVFDGHGGARQADRWDMDARIRDVAMAHDGAVWLIEDSQEGRLLRLTPKN